MMLRKKILIAGCCSIFVAGILTVMLIIEMRSTRIKVYELDGSIVTDTYSNWTNQIVRRSILQPDGENNLTIFGPMKPPQSRHGEWTAIYQHGEKIIELQTWYWYGEKISQGEWHLRNK